MVNYVGVIGNQMSKRGNENEALHQYDCLEYVSFAINILHNSGTQMTRGRMKSYNTNDIPGERDHQEALLLRWMQLCADSQFLYPGELSSLKKLKRESYY
jgi:hypothetical protein